MTSPVLPAAIDSAGNCKVQFVTTIADPSAPTEDEANAVSGFDASCYFTADGWAMTTDEQVLTDDRLCSRAVFEGVGTYTDKLQVKYVFRQQDPDADDNKPFKIWKRTSTGFYLVRYGTAFEPDMAADDYVDVIPVQFDTQTKVQGAKNEMQKIMQNVRITGLVQRDVQIVA